MAEAAVHQCNVASQRDLHAEEKRPELAHRPTYCALMRSKLAGQLADSPSLRQHVGCKHAGGTPSHCAKLMGPILAFCAIRNVTCVAWSANAQIRVPYWLASSRLASRICGTEVSQLTNEGKRPLGQNTSGQMLGRSSWTYTRYNSWALLASSAIKHSNQWKQPENGNWISFM